jgi:hypothetical protein
LPEFKIQGSATAEEIAVIAATVNLISRKKEALPEPVISRWENYGRRGQADRNLWEGSSNSLWLLEGRNL